MTAKKMWSGYFVTLDAGNFECARIFLSAELMESARKVAATRKDGNGMRLAIRRGTSNWELWRFGSDIVFRYVTPSGMDTGEVRAATMPMRPYDDIFMTAPAPWIGGNAAAAIYAALGEMRVHGRDRS